MDMTGFLGKRVGVVGFGESYGRATIENGLVLGRTMYFGHGLSIKDRSLKFFDEPTDMRESGYAIYSDVAALPQFEDGSALSVNLRAFGIAIASKLAFNAAAIYFSSEHRNSFTRSLGATIKEMLSTSKTGIDFEMVTSYMKQKQTSQSKTMLNIERPGEGDVFAEYAHEAVRSETYGIGFVRNGDIGFAQLVKQLAAETVTGMREAGDRFDWK